MVSIVTSMYAALVSALAQGLAAAEALLLARPSLTLMLLSASLFSAAALLQRRARRRAPEPGVAPAGGDVRVCGQEESSA